MEAERLAVYLRSLEPEEPPFLARLRREAEAEGVPIVRPETAALLRTLMELTKPLRVLEVGTAVGYSALLLHSVLPEGGHIQTVEKVERRIRRARENFLAAGAADAIELLAGDAAEVLPGLSPGVDFLFLDAAKGQYLSLLPEVTRLIRPGGVLVADNVLQEGTLLESRFAVPRRDRTIHGRMREMLYRLKHSPQWETAILPVGDGVAVSVRREIEKS